MIDKPIHLLTKEDVEQLVTNARIEDRTIDFKRDLPGSSDEAKKEFLKDVSGFANGRGGDLVFGVQDTNGVATSAPGVPLGNFDELRLRFQSSLRDNLDPRLPSVDIEQVSGFPNGSVVIIRAHQSWRAPHMVTFKGWRRFFVRGNGETHEMDVTELRAAFVGAEALVERIQRFRDGRIAYVLSGQSPLRSLDVPVLVLHIIPFGHAFNRNDVDVRLIGDAWMLLNREGEAVELVFHARHRPNLDGLLLTSGPHEERYGLSDSYIQVFRNGAIEFTYGLSKVKESSVVKLKSMERYWTEAQLLDWLRNGMTFRKEVGLSGPILLTAALLRGRDLSVINSYQSLPFAVPRSFDREVVVLPDQVQEEDVQLSDLPRIVRPLLDSLWQAAGFEGSDSYDGTGAYVRKRIR